MEIKLYSTVYMYSTATKTGSASDKRLGGGGCYFEDEHMRVHEPFVRWYFGI